MKIRLDRLLVAQGLAPTRQKALALIVAGRVRVNDLPVDKAGTQVSADSTVIVTGDNCPFVSRGGLKLTAALDAFELNPTGLICADIGASTGGFTDCLLQRGAAKVYAIDVGYGQLAWSLRQEPRVVVMERFNARNLTPGDLPEAIDLAVIDASFISLKLLIGPLVPMFQDQVAIIALIKPQFEVGKGRVGKGGIVRDPELHQEVIDTLRSFACQCGLTAKNVIASPITGAKGNHEFLVHLVGPAGIMP